VAEDRVERRLAAILCADVAGYSRLMGADEEGTLAALKGHRRELIDPLLATHQGRIVKTTGDGMLIAFPSVVDAVRCAVVVQEGMASRNANLPEDRRIRFRVGINVGDVIVEDGDIFGDGVNVAARLEALAEPGTICVSAVVREQVADKLPIGFADLGAHTVKNIARPVHVFRVEARAAPGAPAAPALALPDRPSIAVLPFQNMSGDAEQEYFCDGMVEDIITGLSRIRWLMVIARNSSFAYKGKAVDVKQVGRELGVRYVLEGSVRKAGGRVRITGQLIEAASGAHLWAERYDRDLTDIFALQDEITLAVIGAIEPSVRTAEFERVKRKRPENLDAYDLVLRAWSYAMSALPDGAAQALPLLERAIALEPNYALAHGIAAWCCEQRWARAGHREEDRLAGIAHARAALAAASDDATALAFAGFVLSMLAHDAATALEALDRSLAISPSSIVALSHGAVPLAFMGQSDRAIERAELALRLSPFDPGRWACHVAICIAHFLAERDEAAAEAARRALELNPNFSSVRALLAAALARRGRSADARAEAERVLATEPGFSARGLASFVYSDEPRDKLVAALAAAGLPA